MDFALSPSHRVDPYLVWALYTDFKYLRVSGDWVSAIFESKGTVHSLSTWVDSLQQKIVKVTPAYLARDFDINPHPISAGQRKYCTGRIKRSFLRQLIEGESVLGFWDYVERFEIAASVMPTNGRAWSFPIAEVSRPLMAMGVIDIGIAYANRDWRNRMRALWDQTTPTDFPLSIKVPTSVGPDKQPAIPVGFPFGREWRITVQSPVLPIVQGINTINDEDSSYRANGFWLAQQRKTHGAAVMGQMFGHLVENDDSAANAPVFAVQLPSEVVSYAARSALSAHVLDGLVWCVQSAGPHGKVVINISMGTQAGPHDGTSILESAIDEWIDVRNAQNAGEHLIVVLAAGNSFDAKCHTLFSLKKDDPKSIGWRIRPDDVTPSYVEIWFRKSEVDGLKITLTSPWGESISAAAGGSNCLMGWDDKTKVAGSIICPRRSAGGLNQMALIALAPSFSLSSNAGLWKISIVAGENLEEVDAYIERDTAMFDPSRRRAIQSRFVELSPTSISITPGTINSLATGRFPIVIGSYIHAQRYPSPYSSAGPGLGINNRRPNAVATGDDAIGRPGVNVSATRSGDVTRLNGTSVSAPQVARMIYNALVSGEINGVTSAAQWIRAQSGVLSAKLPPPMPNPLPEQDIENQKGGGYLSRIA